MGEDVFTHPRHSGFTLRVPRNDSGAGAAFRSLGLQYDSNFEIAVLEHDPEKCVAVFRKDHAQSKTWSAMAIQPDPIAP
jgi:hypothetical protein